jgi:hypothetical protein
MVGVAACRRCGAASRRDVRLNKRVRSRASTRLMGFRTLAVASPGAVGCDDAIAKLAAAVDGTLGRLTIGFVDSVLPTSMTRRSWRR